MKEKRAEKSMGDQVPESGGVVVPGPGKVKLTRSQTEALHDLSRGRTIQAKVNDWGGDLVPHEVPGKTHQDRKPLSLHGNVKTVTIAALVKRGLIAAAPITYPELYEQHKPRIYSITDAGRAALAKARGEQTDVR